MTGLMEYEDVVVENEEDAEKVFGIKTLGSDVTTGALSRDGYYEVARELVKRFDLDEAAITPRESLSASDYCTTETASTHPASSEYALLAV